MNEYCLCRTPLIGRWRFQQNTIALARFLGDLKGCTRAMVALYACENAVVPGSVLRAEESLQGTSSTREWCVLILPIVNRNSLGRVATLRAFKTIVGVHRRLGCTVLSKYRTHKRRPARNPPQCEQGTCRQQTRMRPHQTQGPETCQYSGSVFRTQRRPDRVLAIAVVGRLRNVHVVGVVRGRAASLRPEWSYSF